MFQNYFNLTNENKIFLRSSDKKLWWPAVDCNIWSSLQTWKPAELKNTQDSSRNMQNFCHMGCLFRFTYIFKVPFGPKLVLITSWMPFDAEMFIDKAWAARANSAFGFKRLIAAILLRKLLWNLKLRRAPSKAPWRYDEGRGTSVRARNYDQLRKSYFSQEKQKVRKMEWIGI